MYARIDGTIVHINRPRGHYIGQVRLYGHQRWETVTGHCRSSEKALANAVAKMTREHKRARVLFVDHSGYYDPTITMEASR